MYTFIMNVSTYDAVGDSNYKVNHFSYIDNLCYDLLLQHRRQFENIWELLLKIGTFEIGGRVSFVPQKVSVPFGQKIIRVEVYFEDYYLFDLYEFFDTELKQNTIVAKMRNYDN